MTDSEEIAALRQEVENWKLIAVEQGRRLDIITQRLNTPIDDDHVSKTFDDMLVLNEFHLRDVQGTARRLARDVDDLSSLVRWIEARLVTIEKQPGIVPKKGWIEAKTLSIGTVDKDMMARQEAAMKNIDPS
jgi:hypothetical protein